MAGGRAGYLSTGANVYLPRCRKAADAGSMSFLLSRKSQLDVRFEDECGVLDTATVLSYLTYSELTSMSQAGRAWLLFVLAPVFYLHVRLASGGRQARVPGVPGSAPAPTAPGCSSFRFAGIVGAGQPGAGRVHSRF